MKNFAGRILGFMLCALPFAGAAHGSARAERIGRAEWIERAEEVDTLIVVDQVQVTAIKQGAVGRNTPQAASVFGRLGLERRGVHSVRELSDLTPNLHIPTYGSRMTSSIYVRGLGARIDQPVVGLNVDNVPVMNKDAYDFDLEDVARIEILRGAQSALYGRNTMGGSINVYTLSPLTYKGLRIGAEYATADSWRLKVSNYDRLHDRLGLSSAVQIRSTDGYFENAYDGSRAGDEFSGSARVKVQWRSRSGWMLDNVLSLGATKQKGYPYASLQTGRIDCNDPAGYRRVSVMDGLTLRRDWERVSVSGITSFQFLDDRMELDQDFQPLPYFTLVQDRREYAVTQDVVVRSRSQGRYRWLAGAFGFCRTGRMSAPVVFKERGLQELIIDNVVKYTGLTPDFGGTEFAFNSDFDTRTWGAALYHQSELDLGRWRVTAALRLDGEWAQLGYRCYTGSTVAIGLNTIEPFTEPGVLKKSFLVLLPKLNVQYRFGAGEQNSVYASVAEGYKAGGFNTQMFSEVLQKALKERMGVYELHDYTVDEVVAYDPERTLDVELGAHLESRSGGVAADVNFFWIECRDQQLTVFPEGQTTGRMMTNAGRTRSRGVECSMLADLTRRLELALSYGFTDARFRRFVSGVNDYAGRRVPYAPRQTAAVRLTWTIPVRRLALDRIVVAAGVQGVGDIAWNEANTRWQEFYALGDVSVRMEHSRYALTVWGRNLTDKRYDTFYFMSMGNEFVQHGVPRTFGASLAIRL